MQKGMTLARLTELIDYQHENKRDFIVSTEDIVIRPHEDSTEHRSFTLTIADNSRKKGRLFSFEISRHMLTQISFHTNVPMKLIDEMVSGTFNEFQEIAKLLSIRLRDNPAARLIRTIGQLGDEEVPIARAFLSDRYRVLDNYDLLQAIFPVIQHYKGQLKIDSTFLSDTRLYLKLRFPAVSGSLGKVWVPDGLKVDDIVEAGVLITNSEVGCGAITVRPYIVRLTCMNGATIAVTRRGTRRNHIGRKLVDAINNDQIIDDAKIFAEAADQVHEILSDKKFFRQTIRQFRETKNRMILGDRAAVLAALGRRYQLSKHELELIDTNLGRQKHNTQFALINAVTRTASVRNKGIKYDRSTQLEEIGGRMIDLTEREWKTIGSARDKVA